MRLYLLDLPDGSTTRPLAIAIVAPEARFEDVPAAAGRSSSPSSSPPMDRDMRLHARPLAVSLEPPSTHVECGFEPHPGHDRQML